MSDDLVFIKVKEIINIKTRFINLKSIVSFMVHEDDTSSVQLLNNTNIHIHGNFEEILKEFIKNYNS